MKNILITGGTGLFGLNFHKQFYKLYNIFLIGNKKKIPNTKIYYLDLFNLNKINIFCRKNKIDTIIHAAAMTNIEECQVNKKNCFKINVSLTKLLSKFCNLSGIKFIDEARLGPQTNLSDINKAILVKKENTIVKTGVSQ